MLVNKLKARMQLKEKSDLEKLDKENKKNRESQEKDLANLKTLFTAIKDSIEKIVDGKENLKTNKNNEIYLTDSRLVFNNVFYDKKIISNCITENGKNICEVLMSTLFTETLNEFKEWLNSNGIEIIVYYEHDGGGMTSWNSYYAKI